MKPGRPVIALVEDEPLFRVPLAQGLEDASYNVLSAATGADGLDLLDTANIDLAVVDVRLPGRLTGLDVAREAQRRHPGLPVIIISGKPLEADVSDVGPFLAKPFKLADLLALMTQLIGEQRR